MHELSLARSILDTVATSVDLGPGERYATIRLRVGAISGVEPDALTFGLQVLAADRGWPDVAVEVERTPVRRRCSPCGCELVVTALDTACTRCGESRTALVGGDELEIESVDVEGPGAEDAA